MANVAFLKTWQLLQFKKKALVELGLVFFVGQCQNLPPEKTLSLMVCCHRVIYFENSRSIILLQVRV
jgi:hypothetical protein